MLLPAVLVGGALLGRLPECSIASETRPCCTLDTCTGRNADFACASGFVDCGENCTVALSAELQAPCHDGSARQLIGFDCYACPAVADTALTSSPAPLNTNANEASGATPENAPDHAALVLDTLSCHDSYQIRAFEAGTPTEHYACSYNSSVTGVNSVTRMSYNFPSSATLTRDELCMARQPGHECCLAEFYDNGATNEGTISCYANFDSDTPLFGRVSNAEVTCNPSGSSGTNGNFTYYGRDCTITDSTTSSSASSTSASQSSASTSSSASSSTSAAGTTPPQSKPKSSKLSTDAVIGISIGSVVGAGLLYGAWA